MDERFGDPASLTLHLRRKLHDGLCQQLAGSELLQAALANRLEALRRSWPETSEQAERLREIAADARKVAEVLGEALEEARTIIRELE